MHRSLITALAATLLATPVPAAAQSRAGLTASLSAGISQGFGGRYIERSGIAGMASLAQSVWSTSSFALTVGLEGSFTTSVGVGSDNNCFPPACRTKFPSVSGFAVQLGWISGRPGAAALFSGALGVGRVAASHQTGLGVHLQAGATLPLSSAWAVSFEGRATRTASVSDRHLIVGALLVGLRWHPNGY